MTEQLPTKSNRKRVIVTLLAGIAFFLGLTYGLYRVIAFILNRLAQINPTVSVAIITVCGTIIVSLISVLIAKHYEHKAEIRKEQHSKKVGVYEDFIGIWFDFLFADKLGKERPSEKEFFEKFSPIIRQLIPWGSDDVIKSFVKFRSDAATAETDKQNGVKMLLDFEKLLISIRKDLGHNCSNLKPGDLLKLFVIDFDEHARTTK